MTEKEWRLFNEVLLEIYYSENLQQFGKKCLNLIKIFIPYTQGYFVVVNENGEVDTRYSVFENVSQQRRQEYIDVYFKDDYLMDMCYFSKSMAYRDTDLLSDEKRIGSKMYQNYLKPQKLDLGCGLIIMQDGRTKVFLNLLRTSGEEDVSNHEMEILHTFLPHFEKNVLAYLEHNMLFKKYQESAMEAQLSGREQEIAQLVMAGCSNQEIGDRLGISTATVKKHLSNIFTKKGINRRTQLFQQVKKQE